MPRPKNTAEFRQQLADEFSKILEERGPEWTQGWSDIGDAAHPFNGVTGRAYSGINAAWLGMIAMTKGYDDPRWVTMTQIMDKSGKYHPGQEWHLQAGSKATYVEWWYQWDLAYHREISWDDYNHAIKEEGRDASEFSLRNRYTPVFHVSLVEGIPPLKTKESHPNIMPEKMVTLLSAGMGVDITYGGGRSYYSPKNDTIHLPQPENFASEYDLNSTALHELAHATGHPDRLNRDMSGRFGSQQYAYEELVAEMSSAFAGVSLDTTATPSQVENHKAYVQGWIQTIREKPDTLVHAIRDAQAAAEYMDKIVERSKEAERAVDEKVNTISLDEEIASITQATQQAESDNTPVTPRQENDAHTMAIRHLEQDRGISIEEASIQWDTLTPEDRASRMSVVWKDILAREDSSYRLEANPRATDENDRFIMPNRYYDKTLGLDGTADELFVQARNGYIESPEALGKVQEILSNPVENAPVKAMYVGFMIESVKSNPDLPYNVGQMKKDIYDIGHTEEYFLSNGLVMEARTDAFDECEQVKGCNVIISLVDTQGGQVGGDTIPIEEFYGLSEHEMDERINSIYAYNMTADINRGVEKSAEPIQPQQNENKACANAIEKTIDDIYDGYSLNAKGAKQVVDTYGVDRVENVLAATIQKNDWDGRYSIDNKSWAKGFTVDEGHRNDYTLEHTHPGLINLFTDQVRNIERQQTLAKSKTQERQVTRRHR